MTQRDRDEDQEHDLGYKHKDLYKVGSLETEEPAVASVEEVEPHVHDHKGCGQHKVDCGVQVEVLVTCDRVERKFDVVHDVVGGSTQFFFAVGRPHEVGGLADRPSVLGALLEVVLGHLCQFLVDAVFMEEEVFSDLSNHFVPWISVLSTDLVHALG